MTTETPVEDRLTRAIGLRERGQDADARVLLLELYDEYPEDARVNLHCAWVHDKLGMGSDAVPFYERSIAAGLTGDDLRYALLGLGSTYRALGRYEESFDTLTRGVTEFPEDRALQTFRAMTLYNLGRAKEGCETLLRLLVETTADPVITRYGNALNEYSVDLDRTWT